MNAAAYLEKVYAGFLGMNIGIRLGAPVESGVWTYERIRDTYGDIRDYVKAYKKFAADDDANGPVYFLRALQDAYGGRCAVRGRDGLYGGGGPSGGGLGSKEPAPVTPQAVADAWLNYAREGVGMFWWGGYGVSTEHTAYLNLKNGVPAPRSGSIRQNGKTLAEQIGGQIFIDTWGLIHPGDPEGAARDARAAASVSHDGEGLNGARFIAACIAAAFEETEIKGVMAAGRRQIPADSRYAAVLDAVEAFYADHPEDWRACYRMLVEEWGYDRYPGACHIIPNAGVCALAMLYGGGDFARTIEIATMCSWDTDCNAGNVGTILGVLRGISGIPDHYRRPVNDSLILSGISGYLNILDIPTYAKQVAALGFRVRGQEAPADWRIPADGTLYFDFEIPGSTHGFESSAPYFCTVEHSDQKAHSGRGSLKILMDRMTKSNASRIFFKPFYSRDAFSDERYSPVMTPQVYPGQTVKLYLYLEQWEGWEEASVAPYIRTAFDKKEWRGGFTWLRREEWTEISFTVPDTDGRLIDEVGIVVTANTPAKSRTAGVIYLDDFSVEGPEAYTVCFAKQKKEFGTVTPFSADHGAWEIAEGKLSCMRCGEAFAYAGNYFAADCRVETEVTPENGDSHLLLIHAQGAMRFYAAGLEEGGLVIYKNDFGYEKLAECAFSWEMGKPCRMALEAKGDRLSLSVDGKEMLAARDDAFAYGMYGCGSRGMGRTLFGDFEIRSQV